MTTAVQVQYRRGTAAQVASFTGAQGELIVDTTDNRVVVQDGSTAGGWPAARLSEVITNTRTAVSDANFTAQTTDRLIAYTAITAARTVTLPASSGFPTGTYLSIVDESGGCSPTNSITVSRSGSDTIDGGTSATVTIAYGYLAVQTNGAGKWTIIDQSTTSLVAVAIGTQYDPNNVLSVNGASALFSGSGNFNVTVNKGGSAGASSDTASFIFQDGFTARAQVGLCGDDNFHFKVSNGSSWYSAITLLNSNGYVGLGTELNPQYPVVISQNVTTGLPAANGTTLLVVGSDGNAGQIDLETYNNGSSTDSGNLLYRAARGTAASPSNLLSGDFIGIFGARSFTNGAFNGSNQARIAFIYNDTSPNLGTYIEFDATAVGTTSRTAVMKMQAGVQVGAPVAGDLGVGTINVQNGIYLNNSAYTNPDYVLERHFTGEVKKYADRPRAGSYRGLMQLDALAAHVRENLRLPGITDEPADIFERGDIALEKIEEHTLYILQLHRRVTALEARDR